MAKTAKIINFRLDRTEAIQVAENELSKLLNEGWVIVAAGGAGSAEFDTGNLVGFVVLQRDTEQ